MTLDTVIMLFGAIVAVLPFLQLPQDWMSFLAFIAGIVIVALGITLRRRGSGHNPSSDQSQLFEAEGSSSE